MPESFLRLFVGLVCFLFLFFVRMLLGLLKLFCYSGGSMFFLVNLTIPGFG